MASLSWEFHPAPCLWRGDQCCEAFKSQVSTVRKIVARRPATACLPQRCYRSFSIGNPVEKSWRILRRGSLTNERIRAIGM